MKVLYVEDNSQDIDLTLRELRRTAPDIALEMAGTIAVARMRLRDFEGCISRGAPPPFDLVLLDMNLPDGSGLDVLAEVRRASLSLAVVVLTGSGNEESVLAALRAGADDYLPKRRDYWTQLVDILRSALTRFRSNLMHRARPIHLLYVEPHEPDIQLTRRHLATHAPYIILEVVHTAEQALKRLPPDAPPTDVDVLLLDYRLPGMNALDALKEIVGIRALDLPVILITGQGSEEIALKAFRLGAADYIVKSAGYLFHLPSSVQAAFHRAVAERENAMLVRREEELRQSENRLDLALDASGLAAWEWNLATGIVRFSRHWWPILQYQPEEIPLRIDAWEALTLPEDLAKLRSALAAIMKGSTPQLDIEYRMHAKNGDVRWIRTVGRVVERDAANRVLRMTGTHDDVTSRIERVQQLRESEAKFRALIEQASDGILILDMRGHFQLVNPRACELLGYDAGELVGLHGTVTYMEDARESFNSRLQSVAEGKSLLFERMMRRKDGSAFPVEISARKVSDSSLQYVFRDISERREQERKIARLSRIQRVRSGINAAIVRIRDRQELFDEACRIIV
ncbi:MAG: PAS domain S-box protein, partial [Betaproteobacteria bacterium]